MASQRAALLRGRLPPWHEEPLGPLTHDLVRNLIIGMGAHVNRVKNLVMNPQKGADLALITLGG